MRSCCCTSLLYSTLRGPLPGGERASDQGGGDGTRTRNPLLAKQVRCQLRHAPRCPAEAGVDQTSGDGVGDLGPEGLLGAVRLPLAPDSEAGGADEHEDEQLLHEVPPEVAHDEPMRAARSLVTPSSSVPQGAGGAAGHGVRPWGPCCQAMASASTGTTLLPSGRRPTTANLNSAMPNGIPMIVRQ